MLKELPSFSSFFWSNSKIGNVLASVHGDTIKQRTVFEHGEGVGRLAMWKTGGGGGGASGQEFLGGGGFRVLEKAIPGELSKCQAYAWLYRPTLTDDCNCKRYSDPPVELGQSGPPTPGTPPRHERPHHRLRLHRHPPQ